MAEFIAIDAQTVGQNNAIVFYNSNSGGCGANTRGCGCRNIYHENGTSVIMLRGPEAYSRCAAYNKYQITYNGNIALPEGATVGAIGVAIAINGEARPASIAITTPAAVEEYSNVTSTCIVQVPRCCCFSVSVKAVNPANDATVSPILAQNSNLVIKCVA